MTLLSIFCTELHKKDFQSNLFPKTEGLGDVLGTVKKHIDIFFLFLYEWIETICYQMEPAYDQCV